MEGWWVKRQGGGQECPCISSERGWCVPTKVVVEVLHPSVASKRRNATRRVTLVACPVIPAKVSKLKTKQRKNWHTSYTHTAISSAEFITNEVDWVVLVVVGCCDVVGNG